MILNIGKRNFVGTGKLFSDIPLIIAWKVGIIDHDASKESVVYTDNFPNTLIYDDFPYHKNINAGPMIDIIVSRLSELKELSKENLREAYKTLYGIRVPYFGSVKVLTLLYFLSQGKCPIYDKFAEMSLNAYYSDTKPGESVEYKGLAGNVKNDMSRLVDYKENLEYIFGNEIYESRSIDRALWVYGHLFLEIKKTKKVKEVQQIRPLLHIPADLRMKPVEEYEQISLFDNKEEDE